MERLYGPVLLDAVASGDHDAGDAGRVLADLHALTRRAADPSLTAAEVGLLDTAALDTAALVTATSR